MPLLLRAWIMLLMLTLPFTVVQEVEADSLAPDHVPRAEMLDPPAFERARLQVDACSSGPEHPFRNMTGNALHRLASNKTGGTISAVPHDPG